MQLGGFSVSDQNLMVVKYFLKVHKSIKLNQLITIKEFKL